MWAAGFLGGFVSELAGVSSPPISPEPSPPPSSPEPNGSEGLQVLCDRQVPDWFNLVPMDLCWKEIFQMKMRQRFDLLAELYTLPQKPPVTMH